LRPQEDNAGAVLWLKTFNIRTSTLSFARAIANYTTSLSEHYRSFPEIIDLFTIWTPVSKTASREA
jgi:hypothetical protein